MKEYIDREALIKTTEEVPFTMSMFLTRDACDGANVARMTYGRQLNDATAAWFNWLKQEVEA